MAMIASMRRKLDQGGEKWPMMMGGTMVMCREEEGSDLVDKGSGNIAS